MKYLRCLVSVAAVLGTALIFSGCTTKTARAPRVEPVADFAIVESSTKQALTPAQLAELRVAVENYLQGRGMTGNQVYYVKVTFTEPTAEEDAQWAIVRFGNIPTRTFTLLATYPSIDSYSPYDYYRYGYYNNYGQFSRFGYYDPFDYNYGGYTPIPPKNPNPNPKPDRPWDKPNKPDGKPTHPTGTPTRWEHPRTEPREPRPDHNTYPPRTNNPERWNRERADNNRDRSTPPPRGYSDNNSGGRSYNPPTERYNPPPERSAPSPERYSPPPAPVRSDPPPSARTEETNSTSDKER